MLLTFRIVLPLKERGPELCAQVGMSTRECVFKFLEVNVPTTILFAYALVFFPSIPKFCVVAICIGFGWLETLLKFCGGFDLRFCVTFEKV